MSQRKFHVTEALNNNADVITQIMVGGTDPADETLFTSAELPRPITFRGTDYTHVTADRFQTGETPWLNDPDRVVPITPVFSLMLQPHREAKTGLVTRVEYADFAVEPMFFKDWQNALPIGRFLLPKSFTVYRGQNFVVPELNLGKFDNILGGPDESGPLSRHAAEAITVVSELVRAVGFEALFAEQQLLAKQ